MIGSLNRGAWVDSRAGFLLPHAVGTDGKLYAHESGVNDDVSAMTSYAETGDFDMVDGEDLLMVDKIITDFTLTGSVDLSIKVRKYPNAPETTKGPFTATSSTEKISMRAKGRQAAIRVESSDVGDAWRAGALRLNIQKSGGR